MKLLLDRKYKKAEYTIGNLYIDGVWFCSTLEDRDRGLTKDMPVSRIKVLKVKDKTAIPTGTYAVTLRIQSPKFKYYKAYEFCDGYLPRLCQVPGFDGVLIHCLTPDTEILTEDGWKDMEAFKENPSLRCYSYNTEIGVAELSPINFYVENDYNGQLYCNDGRRINYAVTDKHRMYAGFKRKDGSYVWEFREAKDLPLNSVKFITAATKDGEDITAEQKVFYRILMAVVADGYILNWSKSSSQVRFHFKKERKIARIKSLLEQIGEEWNDYSDSEGSTHIALSPSLSERITEVLNPMRELLPRKDLPWELLRLKSEDLKDLVMEYLFWDGRWENYQRNSKNKVISSTSVRTIDVLQAMATLGGMRTSVKDDTGSKAGDKAKTCYALCLYENQDVVIPSPETYAVKEYQGKVWCLNNDNHTLFIRRNGRVMVIGNCGNTSADTSGCILVGENRKVGQVVNSTATFQRLYKLLKAADQRGENISIEIK